MVRRTVFIKSSPRATRFSSLLANRVGFRETVQPSAYQRGEESFHAANPFARCKRLEFVESRRSKLMKGTLIRYKAAPDRADENQKLIENVFAELHQKNPG